MSSPLDRPHLEVDEPLGLFVKLKHLDGRIVVEHGRATQVDQDAIRRAAADAARVLWQRAM